MVQLTTFRLTPLLTVIFLAASTLAFTVSGPHQRSRTSLQDSYSGGDFGGAGPSNGNVGSIEQIEFKIFPDGRVEESVRGIKGGNCHKVTDTINEQLGKVVDSSPTEEMYEQEVVIDQTLTNSESTSFDGSTPSSW
jgi:hypothetical protein